MIVSLATLDTSLLLPSPAAPRAPGQVREGFRYVRSTPASRSRSVMMALIGTLAYEFQVVLPIVARGTFHGGPETYGFMTAAMGAGAVVGGLIVAGPGRTGVRAIVARGGGVRRRDPARRGRARPDPGAGRADGRGRMQRDVHRDRQHDAAARDPARHARAGDGLWAVAFLGTTPLGGPIAGFVAQQLGGRAGLVLGGAACLVAAGAGVLALRRARVLAPVGG